MAKEKVKAQLPKCLQAAQVPTLTDDEGERLHPHVIDLLRSKWLGDKLTFEGASVSIRENGTGILLTVTSKTAGRMAIIAVSSIITMWDELEDKLKVNGVNWVADHDTKKKARQGVERAVE